jgi:hypothetical protein
MIKRKITEVTEEYDSDGKLKSRVTTTTTEDDDNPYLSQYPYNWPPYPSTGYPAYPSYKTEFTCKGE